MYKKGRKGIVLLVTIMLLLLLLGVMNIFLKSTKETQDDVTYIFALQQTNLVMHNISEYIREMKLDEQSIFYGSKMSFPLEIGDALVTLKLDSAQKKININSFIRATITDNLVADRFLTLLSNYSIQNPSFFLAILQDTLDEDKENRNGESEIVLSYPTFRNKQIYNLKQLEQIKDYYYFKTGDRKIYDFSMNDVFSFYNGTIDMNFISSDILRLLFDDANSYTLELIATHDIIYDNMKDLPFDNYYTKKIEKGVLGQNLNTKTNIITISVQLNYKAQFISKLLFRYNIKQKKILDYDIKKILIVKNI